MIEQRKGTYAAVKYDETTCEILSAWLKLWKIPNPIKQEDFHTTIIYSRVPIPVENQLNADAIELKSRGWRFTPKELALFKSSAASDSTDVLVMILHAPELVNLHQTLREHGATHDFDKYEPHVTLSYEVTEEFDWKRIVLPPVYFIPARIYFEPLDVNWKES